MTNILAIITQLLFFLPAGSLITLLQTLLSVVTSLTASGSSPDQVLAKLLQALTSITP